MPNKNYLIDQLDFLSGALSDRIRSIAFGVLALCWGLLASTTTVRTGFDLGLSDLLMPMLLSLLALVADFGQYLAGYVLNSRLLQELETRNLTEINYVKSHPLYRLRLVSFYAKLTSGTAGAIWLIVIFTIKAMKFTL